MSLYLIIHILCDNKALTMIWAITFVPSRVWKHVVQKGDTVIDATCGNGFDTLALLNLVADDSHNGYVYALDIQKDALDKTSLLLEESLSSNQVRTIKEWRFQSWFG
jgi:ubiquinone/menaquinone biosynthesis C-methylase UbiE